VLPLIGEIKCIYIINPIFSVTSLLFVVLAYAYPRKNLRDLRAVINSARDVQKLHLSAYYFLDKTFAACWQ